MQSEIEGSETPALNDVYQIITDRIISALEAGTVPWNKPWQSKLADGSSNAPANYRSGKAYRGVNAFLLGMTPYDCPLWLTFKQAKEAGGCVRKGEKGMPVVFWKRLLGVDKATGEKKVIPLLRYYTVFNVRQCEGIEWNAPIAPVTGPAFDPIANAVAIIEGMQNRPEIRHAGPQAYYSPSLDYVNMPKPEAFNAPEMYYSISFHELTHATGHKGRLNRKGVAFDNARFGSETYSKEELVAEMGAAFLCGHAGILNATIGDSAAYVANWLKVLKDDRKLVVQAAGLAQRAADYILGVTFSEEKEAS